MCVRERETNEEKAFLIHRESEKEREREFPPIIHDVVLFFPRL